MAEAIIDGTNINTGVLSYSAPKAHESGGKVVNVYNKYFKESLTISTPLILTWGAQEGVDQAKKPTGKYTMSLQFPNADFPNADCQAFLTSMRALEAKIKADALVNSKEWFGKVITNPEIIEEKFNVMLRHPKFKGTEEADVSKAPTLTVKVPCWKGVWKSEIYDEDGEPLYVGGKTGAHLSPLDFLKPKTHVICLIQCGGIWFVNGKFSITWNLKQAIVQKPKASMEGQCFIKLKTADKEKLKALPPVEHDEVDPDGAVATIVEDSDDEAPATTPVTSVFVAPVVTPVVTPSVEPAVTSAAVTEKKKIVRKKTDA
jgi:hypothetical protein